jgi:hypothetical protein
MSSSELKSKWERAESAALKIQADRDDAIAKVRARYNDKLAAAVDKAAQAQKDWRNEMVVESLLDRPDGRAVCQRFVEQGALPKAALDRFPPEGR